MKLVFNINCYNEEQTLAQVLNDLPRSLPGITEIEVQVIDDGSDDRTAEIARQHGALVLTHAYNRGLGAAFKTGLQAALDRGADLMVNTDGDGQYPAANIPQLIAPILADQADIVIGNRRPWKVAHFSPLKRVLQWLGSASVRRLIGADVPDVVSGLRAYSAEAMLRLNPMMDFSYVLDVLVQAARKGLRVTSVPVSIRQPTRPSRLYRNLAMYLLKSTRDVLWVYVVYAPLKTFMRGALVFFIPAAFLLARFMYFYLRTGGQGHVQSLVIATIGFSLAGILFSLGMVAQLVSYNRRLLEEQLYWEKRRRWEAARQNTQLT